MLVYLLRHGLAEERSIDGTDGARRLTQEGIDRLDRAAAAWRRVLQRPDRIVSSPLLRARETAAALCRATSYPREIDLDEALVPSGRPVNTLELLQGEMLAGSKAVALVGHEPHLGCLLGLLLTGNDLAAVPLKKGMLVGVEVESPSSMLAHLRFALTTRLAAELG